MMASRLRAVLTALVVFVSLACAQLNVPQCISKCIDQSTDDSCKITDIKCICRESNGRFLPDVVTCMHANCDNNLDTNLLLTPLQLLCQLAGTPISSSALANAQNLGSSLATTATKTVTTTGQAAQSLTTVTLTTTAGGSTIVIAYPGTIGNTVSGAPSTVTPIAPASTTTNSAGQSLSQTASGSGTQSSAVPSNSGSITTTPSTTIAAQATTQSTPATTSANSQNQGGGTRSSNSGSPFDQNAAVKEQAGTWLGLSVFLMVAALWL